MVTHLDGGGHKDGAALLVEAMHVEEDGPQEQPEVLEEGWGKGA